MSPLWTTLAAAALAVVGFIVVSSALTVLPAYAVAIAFAILVSVAVDQMRAKPE